ERSERRGPTGRVLAQARSERIARAPTALSHFPSVPRARPELTGAPPQARPARRPPVRRRRGPWPAARRRGPALVQPRARAPERSAALRRAALLLPARW